MILQKSFPVRGICFAWLPVWTPDGKVWLEDVHYSYNDFGFGSYSYRRIRYKRDAFGLSKIDYAPELERLRPKPGPQAALFAEPVRPGD